VSGLPFAPILTTLCNSPEARWLEQSALRALTREQDPRDARFGTTPGSLSAFILRKSWR